VTVDAWLLGAAMALSPLAVLASLLLLTTERGTTKAVTYAVGWVVAVGSIGVLTVAAASTVHASPGSTTSTVSSWLYVLLGVVLVGWAIRRRVAARDGAPEPTWMGRLDGMSPVVSLGFGLFMPPYAIAVAAVNSIVHGNAGGPAADVVVPVVTFTVVASLGVIVPVAFALLSSSSDAVIARGREWLLARWSTVLFWMLVVVGGYLVAKGVYLLVT